jgi:hypothetical protein
MKMSVVLRYGSSFFTHGVGPHGVAISFAK